MSENNNCGDFIPTEDFPDFIIDPWMSFQIISIIISCYFNRRVLRFTSRDMCDEFVRYISFYRFPASSVDIHEFIRAGFYYSSYQDFVICYCCGYRRGNWQETDSPNDIHRQFSPTCIFFRQQSTVNIQINEMFQDLGANLRQNPTGPLYTPALSMLTDYRYRESQPIESHGIIRMLPPADLQGPPINRPWEGIHFGPFDVRRPALIQNSMIETENGNQSQVHGELVNPFYAQSNRISSEGCPALTYSNHHTNSETHFEQRYEKSHSTGYPSDSSQDTTELKTVFRHGIQSSEVVERNTNLSEYQKVIKRASHASFRLSREGLQNGDVFPTEINRNDFDQVKEVTEERTILSAEAELLNRGQEIQSSQEINREIENIQITENHQVTPADLEINQLQEVTDEKTAPMLKAERNKESQEIDSNQETTQEKETNQDIDTNQKTEINEKIPFTQEILVSSLENEGRSVTNVSSTVDIGLDEENNETVPVHTLQASMTDLREQHNILQNSELRIDETEINQLQEVTDEKTTPLPKEELHKESQEIDSYQERSQQREANQDIDTNQMADINQDISFTQDIYGNQFGIIRLNSGKIPCWLTNTMQLLFLTLAMVNKRCIVL